YIMRRVEISYSTVLLLTTFIFAGFAAAQTPKATPTPRIDDEIIKVSSRLVVVPVAVTDAGGNPVPGLTTTDFKVAEDGRTVNLDAVSSAEQVPLEIALLFDISASTDAMFKFEQQTAASFLKDVMR